MAMKTKAYKPSVGSKGEEKAEERAFMSRKRVTVKEVRDGSRADKAKVAATKTTSKPGESKMATTEATRKSRDQEKRYPSAEDRKMATVGQEQRFRPAPDPTPANKSIMGSIINRVTQPPRQLSATSKAMLAETSGELNTALSVVGGASKLAARIGMGIVKRGAAVIAKKAATKALPSPQKLLTGPKPNPTGKYVPKKVKFPKAVRGRKIKGTGTYSQFGD